MYYIIFILIIQIRELYSIPIQNDFFNNIRLYDYRYIFSNEYRLTITNFETNDFIDLITPFPLAIDQDVYCEKILDDEIEVLVINCEIWNQLKLYSTDYYDTCNIKRNIGLFGKTIEFTEIINKEC
jgi:hypothetical protein